MKNQTQVFLTSLRDKIFKDDIVTQAAALALYAALAFAPLILLLLAFLSSLRLSLQGPLIFQIQNLMGPQAAAVLEMIINTARENNSSNANTWGLIVLAISASAIFAQLQSSLNIIFESQERVQSTETWQQYLRQFLSRRLICFGMVLTFIFISIVSLVISSSLALFASEDFAFWMKLLQFVGSLFVFALLFSVILKWMPDRKVLWASALRGGAITAFLFMIGKVLIGLYLGKAAIGSAYGAAGSLIVLLVWVYYSSLTVLFGAEISSTLDVEPHKPRSSAAR